MNELNLNDRIVAEKKCLERDIGALLETFKKDTGLGVSFISIKYSVQERGRCPVLLNVECGLKLEGSSIGDLNG